MQSGKAHLEIGQRREADTAQYGQLQQLESGEEMDLALRHRPDVVVRRVSRLHVDAEKNETKLIGRRNFAVAGLTFWNTGGDELRIFIL